MTQKYSDLEERIKRDRDLSLTGLDRVTYTLRWLDRNPDQVPGRTITESELSEAVENSSAWTDEGFGRDIISHFGIEVVPDPEPTNAEKWEKFIRGTHFNVSGWTGFDATEQFAKILDEQGVKAPGGYDD